jgi:hypothetical protein
VQDLLEALRTQNYNKTQLLLEKHFEEVAVGEYAWLAELRQLGYSALEMTDELMEKFINGPWIFEPFKVPLLPTVGLEFHLPGCVHSSAVSPDGRGTHGRRSTEPSTTDIRDKGITLSTKEAIEYLCGVGGVRPGPEGTNELDYGSVSFQRDGSTATVALIGPEDNGVVQEILHNVEQAAGALQQLGGCCDSFTYLYARDDHVELYRTSFSAVRRLRDLDARQQELSQDSSDVVGVICEIMPFFNRAFLSGIWLSDPGAFLRHCMYISAQFVSLAFLFYLQAHCGPLKPFYLDKGVEEIHLVGHEMEDATAEAYRGLMISSSLVHLTCMGKMTGGPVFAFHHTATPSTAAWIDGCDRPPQSKLDLFASPEAILDTWGPGVMVASAKEPCWLRSMSVGDGIIYAPARTDSLLYTVSIGDDFIYRVGDRDRDPVLHWSSDPLAGRGSTYYFSRAAKARIAGGVVENQECHANPTTLLQKAAVMLEDMGTFPSYWELAERQGGIGVQAGQTGVVALQFNQTWKKMAGRTKKASILGQNTIYIPDLDAFFGVQVSVCTGVARRVRLRDLLADIVPAYVTGLVTKPPLWKSLLSQNMIQALRESSISDWLERLDYAHQQAFEALVIAVLHLLRDTGVDRKGQNFSIACIQPHLPFKCFKIPCKNESYWARMLADSEETATFAYVTTQCLETCNMKCSGLSVSWTNSTSLLSTAVSCYEERIAEISSLPISNPWELKHLEAYLIGRPDMALFVQVDRPGQQTDPKLLVTISNIPTEFLYRFYRKAKPGKPRRLREMKAWDIFAEGVVVLVG